MVIVASLFIRALLKHHPERTLDMANLEKRLKHLEIMYQRKHGLEPYDVRVSISNEVFSAVKDKYKSKMVEPEVVVATLLGKYNFGISKKFSDRIMTGWYKKYDQEYELESYALADELMLLTEQRLNARAAVLH